MLNPWIWAKVDSVGIAVTLIVLLLFIVLPIYLVAKLLVFLFRMLTGRGDKPSKPSTPTQLPQWSQAILPLALVVFFALMFWYVPSARTPQAVPGPGPSTNSNLPWMGLLGGVAVVGVVLFTVLRQRDSSLALAAKQQRANNLDAAIQTLSEAIETRPTAERANSLACLLIQKKDWPAVYKRLRQARELGLDEVIYRSNMAHVLRMMDRPADALDILEPHVKSVDANPIEVCHYIEALLDLNRMDAALEQIQRVESTVPSMVAVNESARQTIRDSIDHCRQRFEDRMGKKPLAVSDEL